ncbi:MAG TPA: M14 family zinc carboxypeptidase [Anaerolineales bacterium]|nr:M14 family zinc carboxypeptidase [Anaerolineales bacterium]
MPHRKKSSHAWVYVIWGINGIALLAVLFVAVLYTTSLHASAAEESPVTLPPEATREIPPTSYFLPTLTPNPFYTPPAFETSTPFGLADGPRPSIIGFSLAGRPIEAYTFGVGEKEYLIVAGIHGGYEWNTIALANELITHINENPGVVPSDVTLHIIRNMNPDGEARAHGIDGRVNNNGVDLNRNFPSDNWTVEWDRDGCWIYRPTTGGIYGGSEPETRTVMSFIRNHKIEALISYHSAALGVFPGGVPWTGPSKRLANALAKTTGYPYPPIDTGCEYTGTLADWAVENGVGAAVDMELRNHSNTDFEENLKALKVFLNFVP